MAVHRNSTRSRRLTQAAPAAADTFLADVLAGLRQPHKTLPCKYFYDAAGSALFDAICDTPEYYPTRTELGIMRAHAADMAAALGAGCGLVELGSGSSVKTRLLLKHLPRPAAYFPVDISGDHLHTTARDLARRFPDIDIRPVAADFTRPFDLPATPVAVERTAVYFPGSTVGNFTPPEAVDLLKGIADLCGPGGLLLIGVDLKKDPAVLHAAYNDAAGVTAAFNLNLLDRINRELDADFDLTGFRHQAIYDSFLGRVEMHLVSVREQAVNVAGNVAPFAEGETIHTENSHKYTVAGFQELAAKAGFAPVRAWTDAANWFSVQLLRVR